MKRTLTAIGALLITATAASAEYTPWDRAFEDGVPAKATTGATEIMSTQGAVPGPNSDWTASGQVSETVFGGGDSDRTFMPGDR